MKIAASNIAWPAAFDSAAYYLLAESGVHGVEVAPTRIWPEWEGISAESIREVQRALAAEGLVVSSLQAILFQKPELRLFSEDVGVFAEHLQFCADLAARLGARSVVFGAPKNRDRGALSEDEAFERAGEVLGPIAEGYAAVGVTLAFEANPAQYGCNFITTASDAARLVRAVDSPGLRLHLDTACAALAGEDIVRLVREHADILAHFHATEPMLGPLGVVPEPHASAARALCDAGYEGWVAIEMRAQEDVESSLKRAAEFAVGTYGEAA